jgi:hypothetical protein
VVSDNALLEHIRNMAVSMHLIVIYEAATPERGHVCSLYYGKTCLHRTSDLSTVEFYLYGYRDGRTVPHPDAHKAADALLELKHYAEDVRGGAQTALHWIDKLDEFIDPLTRERS